MRISGVMPLRNAVKLGYPFELAIRSMRPLCDEVVVLVDPTSEDDTLARVRALAPDRVVESAWNMQNHDGMNDEIAKQTAIACDAATGDWILSLQADEVMHEEEAATLRAEIERADADGTTALELMRWYFFGTLDKYRDNWTVPLPRLIRRGRWLPDPRSGAMYFIPATPTEQKAQSSGVIFHYSRIGDPALIACRIRNLDLFYHDPDEVKSEQEIEPYTFDLRKLDTYVVGHEAEADTSAHLCDFPTLRHPAAARAYFGVES